MDKAERAVIIFGAAILALLLAFCTWGIGRTLAERDRCIAECSAHSMRFYYVADDNGCVCRPQMPTCAPTTKGPCKP